MGHIVGIEGLATAYFCVVPPTQRFKSSRQTSTYGVPMIHYEIIPRTLSNMGQEFHLNIYKC
jgi:hypothetical protein